MLLSQKSTGVGILWLFPLPEPWHLPLAVIFALDFRFSEKNFKISGEMGKMNRTKAFFVFDFGFFKITDKDMRSLWLI